MSIKRTLIGALIGSCDAGIGKPSIRTYERTRPRLNLEYFKAMAECSVHYIHTKRAMTLSVH